MPFRDHVILHVNGQRHEIAGRRAFQSLSDFLRYDLALVGTKVVCAEGDCGSCSVFLGRVDQSTKSIKYESVCSCIQFLCQLDCTHIVTIEGLKYDGKLNPVQEAMVQFQGSQCGFCTPGFVVSMCAMHERSATSGLAASAASESAKEVQNACIGNLCRCTGYDSILRAGMNVDPKSMRPLNQLYPQIDLQSHATESVLIRDGEKQMLIARSIDDAVNFRKENPDCTIIAGGTDIGVQVNKNIREPKTWLSLAGLDSLRTIELKDGAIIAGALASILQLEEIAKQSLPEYAKMLHYFGSPPIRSAGTVGGNIANGSPIADSMPAMYVLNAEIELTGVNGTRRVNINDFFTGYKKTVATSDELITRVIIPLPAKDEIFKLYKISRRKDLDISAFTAAIWMKRAGETITEARIAFGGVGPNILRLKKTEEYFRGKALTEETTREAGKIARGEIKPISDVRGGADYRFQLGENILRKMYAELSNGNGNGNLEPQMDADERR